MPQPGGWTHTRLGWGLRRCCAKYSLLRRESRASVTVHLNCALISLLFCAFTCCSAAVEMMSHKRKTLASSRDGSHMSQMWSSSWGTGGTHGKHTLSFWWCNCCGADYRPIQMKQDWLWAASVANYKKSSRLFFSVLKPEMMTPLHAACCIVSMGRECWC